MSDEKYLPIREAAKQMKLTRQYVYRELNGKFKDYLRIINGKKYLEESVINYFSNIKLQVDSKQSVNLSTSQLVGSKLTDENKSRKMHINSRFYSMNGYQKDSQPEDYCKQNGLQVDSKQSVNLSTSQLVDNKLTDENKSRETHINSRFYSMNDYQKASKPEDYCKQNGLQVDSKQSVNLSTSQLYNFCENNNIHENIIDTLKQQLLEKDKQLAQKDEQINILQKEMNISNEHLRKQSDKLVGLIEQINELQRNNQILLAQKGSRKNIEIIDENTEKYHENKPSKNFLKKIFWINKKSMS